MSDQDERNAGPLDAPKFKLAQAPAELSLGKQSSALDESPGGAKRRHQANAQIDRKQEQFKRNQRERFKSRLYRYFSFLVFCGGLFLADRYGQEVFSKVMKAVDGEYKVIYPFSASRYVNRKVKFNSLRFSSGQVKHCKATCLIMLYDDDKNSITAQINAKKFTQAFIDSDGRVDIKGVIRKARDMYIIEAHDVQDAMGVNLLRIIGIE